MDALDDCSIKQLSNSTISKISAGEVVLRPASVVKELIENSCDAGASKISIYLEEGGINSIEIVDDGIGMNHEELCICALRHTTSKLNEEDIDNIITFGFRGEALYSISSVADLSIISRKPNEIQGNRLEIENSKIKIFGVNSDYGTKVSVKSLFHNVPARLKFLKTAKQEFNECLKVVQTISLPNKDIHFRIYHNGKLYWESKSDEFIHNRIADVIGADFINNSFEVDYSANDIKIWGISSIPTFNTKTYSDCYIYINGRYIKDKNLSAIIKLSYKDVMEGGRYPVSVIFVEMPYHYVDVNVHPAKTEVRFRDQEVVKRTMMYAIKDGLYKNSSKTSSLLANKTIEFITNNAVSSHSVSNIFDIKPSLPKESNIIFFNHDVQNNISEVNERNENFMPKLSLEMEFGKKSNSSSQVKIDLNSQEESKNFLGYAKCQLANTYIISEANNEIILVDQHAAHERILYERYKTSLLNNKQIARQKLIIEENIELSEQDIEIAEKYQFSINDIGIIFRIDGNNLYIQEVPFFLIKSDYKSVVIDIVSELKEYGYIMTTDEIFEKIFETMACHLSIRAGHHMDVSEMNQLLRDIENTPFSAQCNHGRPTYIKLAKKDIEKLFGRA